MHKRIRSFYNSTTALTACLLLAGLLIYRTPHVQAQAVNEPTGAVTDTLSADEADLGPDPVATSAQQTTTPVDSLQVLTDTSTEEPQSAEESQSATTSKQPLNHYAAEAFAALQQRAADRPVLFSAVLAGLTALLAVLAIIRSRHRRHAFSYIALTRHYSHI